MELSAEVGANDDEYLLDADSFKEVVMQRRLLLAFSIISSLDSLCPNPLIATITKIIFTIIFKSFLLRFMMTLGKIPHFPITIFVSEIMMEILQNVLELLSQSFVAMKAVKFTGNSVKIYIIFLSMLFQKVLKSFILQRKRILL